MARWSGEPGMAPASIQFTASRSGAVALLVLLARAAPAGVVTPDLVLLVDPALLDDRQRLGHRAVGLGISLGRHAGAGAGGRSRQRAGLGGTDAARVGHVRRARGCPAGR